MRNILDDDFNYILKSNINFKNFTNKTVLITGATGLIGSLLVRFLLYINKVRKINVKVLAVVRNLEKAKSIFGTVNDDYLDFIVCDLIKDNIVYNGKIDYIIHAAAITKSKTIIEHPVETINLSVIGTNKLLKLALENNVKSFIYISSMEVYGQPTTNGKVNERQIGKIDLSSIRSCYPESKRVAELLCRSYFKEYGLNIKIARLAQTFGAGVLPSESRIFVQFARSIIENKDIILHTSGRSEGNYVYSSDALKALLLLLFKGEPGEEYNVSNEENHLTIYDMAKLVQEQFGNEHTKVRIVIPNENTGYAPDVKLWLDNSKLKALGWEPKVDLKESYSRLIEWMRFNDLV